ncbi:hypothetical protein RJ640_005714 [Escallonia rubra]|uniref:Uncharacterized protein n=1 Tax=Escallonia rubra TaxID=112253 RepID=A0AA88RMS0_9ASTE|nr:hypothetical protein RJ640_005714 [Escallonia rubra]
MKKLYRKGTVHPSPPLISDQLAFLPATILTLAAALSPEDREVLAYLISCSTSNCSSSKRSTQKASTVSGGGGGAAAAPAKAGDHPACYGCSCFGCYMSYWVRWDSSPNRQLIHEIIDAFEDGLVQERKREKGKKERRRKRGGESGESTRPESGAGKGELSESDSVEEGGGNGGGQSEGGGGGAGGGGDDEEEEGFEKGSVRKFVSFLGERIWSVWT